ncbi:ubiquitin carboxyl-terminal hydrolase 47-like [Boleophthalmus pectinirostris]|uniref:ubiquitin carboxyl-terminal hydrolase 47-like n=1 Tax=Boleophthalmus pectinirostris TaxID=150288 RepID=UPI00243164DF|nr:ubiquitin carboxyl-terminal hydrolase 47-like [Boleophthalmus pectinirostris]
MFKRKWQTGSRDTSLHGLWNQGATCYLNSVLQVLFMTPEVHEGLKRNTSTDDSDGVLKDVFDKLKQDTSETTKITDLLQIRDVHRQHDAAEYLELLLNRLSPDVSKPFRGTLTNKTECEEGHCIIEETTDFWTLPLALSDCTSVAEGFQKVFETQSFNVYCTVCKESTDAKRCCQMKTPPTVLVLLLKRFIIDPRNGFHYKSKCEVELSREIETEVKMQEICKILVKVHSCVCPLLVQGLSFSLCGVVDHQGSAHGGHYTVSMKSQEDQNWYCFSDAHVHETEEPAGQRSKTAYLLIYRALPTQRKELPPKDQMDSEDHSFLTRPAAAKPGSARPTGPRDTRQCSQ